MEVSEKRKRMKEIKKGKKNKRKEGERKPFEMEKTGKKEREETTVSLYKMGPEWLDKYTFTVSLKERKRERKEPPDLMAQKQQSEAAVVQKLIDPIAVAP